MPDYTTLAALSAFIPGDHISQALDDTKDGTTNAANWAEVLSAVHEKIDGILSARFVTPFSNPLPAKVAYSARIFASDFLYRRRGVDEKKNPWKKTADDLEKELKAIAEGKAAPPKDFPKEKKSGSIVAETAKTTSAAGLMTA